MIHNNSATNLNSYNNGSTNPFGLSGAPPDPSTLGLPGVSNGFANSYLIAYSNLVGTTPELTNNLNYKVNPGGAAGSTLGLGTFVDRNFISNEFEYFLQDSWRVTPKLTITYGLRHTLLQVPYEANGQQVAPTIDTHQWFLQRALSASQGQVYNPDLSFAPNGPSYNKPGYWDMAKANIAPRFAIAYALDNKTSIRAGAGMYYDHFGQGIVNAFDSSGSFGLSTSLSSPLGALSTENAPRYTGRFNLPNLPLNGGGATGGVTYPFLVPQDSFLITWGVDNHLKTPYSEVFNLSVQRELPGGFTFEAAYVGRLGRHLLQQTDLATPTNFVDTKSGTSYFQAGSQLSRLVDQNGGNSNAHVAPIPFFENLFPWLASPGQSATQFIYTNEWSVFRSGLGATTSLADLDFYCVYTCPQGSRFWQDQFSSLYAWTSNGSSTYNAGQFILRHPMSHGLQMDFSYTYGQSIDMGSDVERSGEFQANGPTSFITNAWDPGQSRGPSDFDVRHLITANWVYQLPFGKGGHFAPHANRALDLLIGGWQFSGIARWTSGLPFSLSAPGFETDWQNSSFGVNVGGITAKKTILPDGTPNAFANASAINDSIINGGPLERLPYVGESGQRNNFRTDGYFGVDSGLSKVFKVTEAQQVRFGWEVFNVTNSVRFDSNSINTGLTSGTLGNFSRTTTTPRRMEFSLRYSF